VHSNPAVRHCRIELASCRFGTASTARPASSRATETPACAPIVALCALVPAPVCIRLGPHSVQTPSRAYPNSNRADAPHRRRCPHVAPSPTRPPWNSASSAWLSNRTLSRRYFVSRPCLASSKHPNASRRVSASLHTWRDRVFRGRKSTLPITLFLTRSRRALSNSGTNHPLSCFSPPAISRRATPPDPSCAVRSVHSLRHHMLSAC
jgi:hypothetical protein